MTDISEFLSFMFTRLSRDTRIFLSAMTSLIYTKLRRTSVFSGALSGSQLVSEATRSVVSDRTSLGHDEDSVAGATRVSPSADDKGGAGQENGDDVGAGAGTPVSVRGAQLGPRSQGCPFAQAEGEIRLVVMQISCAFVDLQAADTSEFQGYHDQVAKGSSNWIPTHTFCRIRVSFAVSWRHS